MDITNILSAAIFGSIMMGAGVIFYRFLHLDDDVPRGPRRVVRSGWERVGMLEAINIYPLKSGAPWSVERAACYYPGPYCRNTTDRTFAVYEGTRIIIATTNPKLLKIKVVPTFQDYEYRFTSSSGQEDLLVDVSDLDDYKSFLSVEYPPSGFEYLETHDCGDEAAAWISSEIGRPGARLGYWIRAITRDEFKPKQPRRPGHFNSHEELVVYHATRYSWLLLNRSSVEDLAYRIGPDSTVGVEHFRANLIIAGAEPYAEDSWRELKIGRVSFKMADPCSRGILINIDPNTLVQDPDNEPLKTLETYRQLPKSRYGEEDKIVMGSFMDLLDNGIISVGDPVYALPARENIFDEF